MEASGLNKYNNAKIYQIVPINVVDETDRYIGSTCRNLEHRLRQHLYHYNKFLNGKYEFITSFLLFEKYGINGCKIELIEIFACSSNKELQKREGVIIKSNKCINKNIPGRTSSEYYIDNKEEINENQKLYYIDNKEKISEYKKLYYIDNKEEISENKKLFYIENKEKINHPNTCICGGNYTTSHKSRHLKSIKHTNYINNLLKSDTC